MPKLIGLTGGKGQGKDTAAKFGPCKSFAFADPLKQAAMAMFDLTHEQVYDEALKDQVDVRYDKTPRQLLQWLGTDVIRDQFSKNHWLTLMEYKLIRAMEEGGPEDVITVTDCRFSNECDLIRSLGGRVVRIVREMEGAKADAHASEKGVPDSCVDFTFKNDGTKEQLWERMRCLVVVM